MRYDKVPEDLSIDYQKMLDYAFDMQAGEKEYGDKKDLPEYLAEKRGILKDGDLLCTAAYHLFEVFLRGKRYKLAGIADVSSLPENRHKGYIRRIMLELLHELREKEIYLSLLWPFSHAFYKKMGWGLINKMSIYKFNPDILKFTGKLNSGRFRRVKSEDLEDIKAVYEKYAVKYNLAIKRSKQWWNHQIFKKGEDEPYCYLWEVNGEPRSYLIYRAKQGSRPGWGNWIMDVEEVAFLDIEAFMQLFKFIYYHQSQLSRVYLQCPEDIPLFDLVYEPTEVESIVKPGSMFRLVDVKKALEMLAFPEKPGGNLIFRINDPLLEWNSGVFECEIARGQVKCKKSDKNPGFILDVEVLSQIYAGYLSPVQACLLNKLKVEDDADFKLLNKLFPSEKVYLQEHF